MRWLVLLLALSSCTVKTYSEHENHRGDTQSTYDVWDYEIVSAYEMAGQRFRVAVINERHFAEGVPEAQGSDGLDDQTRKSIAVGTTKQITLDELRFFSMKESQPINVRALKNSRGVVVRVTHVKSCPVTTSESEHTSIVGDSSKGIITIPKLKTVIVRENSVPACADPSDRVLPAVTAPSAPSKEVAAALAATAKEAAETNYRNKLNKRFDDLMRDFEKRSREMKQDGTSDIEKSLCPALSGRMKAAGINEIVFDRHEISRVEGKGYTEIRFESSATLMPMKSKFADGDLSRAATLLRRLKVVDDHCLGIELSAETNPPSDEELRKIAQELETVIHRHMNGVLYDQSLKEMGPKKN